MLTLPQQNKILKKYFGITVLIPKKLPTEPEGAEGTYLIPEWSRIAKTYPQALQKALDAIKSTRPFYNYREGQIDEKHLRRLNPEVKVPEILSVQMGSKYKGVSVEKVRNKVLMNELPSNSPTQRVNEILLGAYEVAIIILLNPDVLKSYDDLWIDCPADEWSWEADGVFSVAPFFWFSAGRVGFGARDVGYANAYFGSASGFLSQNMKLEDRTLDTSRFSILEARISELERKINSIHIEFN